MVLIADKRLEGAINLTEGKQVDGKLVPASKVMVVVSVNFNSIKLLDLIDVNDNRAGIQRSMCPDYFCQTPIKSQVSFYYFMIFILSIDIVSFSFILLYSICCCNCHVCRLPRRRFSPRKIVKDFWLLLSHMVGFCYINIQYFI